MEHLSCEERVKIEVYLEQGYNPHQISKLLNRSHRTIYEEIKRGSCPHLNSDLTVSNKYGYDVGERVMRERRANNPGRPLAIGNNIELADRLEELVVKECYSPYCALEICKREGLNVNIGLSTFYSYIHKNNVFLNLCDKHLPYYHKKKTKKQNERKPSNKNLRGRSISERPDYINNRETFGHWELDTVVGEQGSCDCLFVFTERKTTDQLIFKQPHKSIECCINVLDTLEINYGALFPEIFRSITCDNGVEFLGTEFMERSFLNPDVNRTTVYYCHAYCSSERGQNENQNRLIRRFIPKGVDISQFSDEYIQYIQDFINNMPRRKYGGRSSAEMAAEYGFS